MAVSRRRPERERRRESFLPQQNAQNIIEPNSEMNVYLHPGVCQPEREEAVDDLKESLKSANRQRCVALMWKLEMGQNPPDVLKEEIKMGNLWLPAAWRLEYQNEAQYIFRVVKAIKNEMGPLALVNLADIRIGRTGLAPAPLPTAGECQFVIRAVAMICTLPPVPAPGPHMPDPDAANRRVGRVKAQSMYKHAVRLMNSAIGRANRKRCAVVLWSKEAREGVNPLWNAPLDRIRLTPRGLRHILDDHIKAQEDFLKRKTQLILGNIPEGGVQLPGEPPQGVPQYAAPVFP